MNLTIQDPFEWTAQGFRVKLFGNEAADCVLAKGHRVESPFVYREGHSQAMFCGDAVVEGVIDTEHDTDFGIRSKELIVRVELKA